MSEGFNIWNAITGSLALLGAVLGVMNSWKAFVSDKLKLRVRLNYVYTVNAPHLPPEMIGVEVINLSKFPVTISEVGLTILGSTRRGAFIGPITNDGVSLPRRLESREAVTALVDLKSVDLEESYRHVYARTACGETITFRQKNIHELIESRRK